MFVIFIPASFVANAPLKIMADVSCHTAELANYSCNTITHVGGFYTLSVHGVLAMQFKVCLTSLYPSLPIRARLMQCCGRLW